MKFKVVKEESDCSEKVIQQLRGMRKWKTQFLETISKEEILRLVTVYGETNEEVKIYTILAYLTAGRRNEVLMIRKSDISKQMYFYSPQNKEYEVTIFHLANEKNKKYPDKLIPVVRGIDETIDLMLDEVKKYTNEKDGNLFRKIDPTSWNKFLEKIEIKARYRDNAWAITEDLVVSFSLFPHYLRHCRLTDLGSIGSQELVQVSGWSYGQMQNKSGVSANLLETYIRRVWQNVVDSMIRNRIG